MYKFLFVLVVMGLTACGSSASSDTDTTTDSTGIAADTIIADSSVVTPVITNDTTTK